jgi:anti-sigma factor (TIGR02949 family)
MSNENHSKHDHAHDDIGCIEAIEALYAYLDGELDEASTEDFERHMSHCRSCYSRAQMERALSERMKREGQAKAPEELQSRLKQLFDDF